MSDIYNTLLQLTKGSFFSSIENFEKVVANHKDVLPNIDLTDCVEFGTHNGQELLIYNMKDGRKHIKYSCMFTHIFDELVIQNVYSDTGKEYEFDYNKTFERIEKKQKENKNK